MERQSALHRWHLEVQAHLKTFSGWKLPAWYKDPSSELEDVRASAGICDVSYLTKLDLRGPAGEFRPPAQVWKLTPTRALITSPQLIDFVPSSSVTDVTSIYSAILLAGPKAHEVLHKLTTLNVSVSAMPEGVGRQTRLAHANAIILRGQGFLILNTRDVTEHVWEALLHAGACPFGMVAKQHWMGFSDEDA